MAGEVEICPVDGTAFEVESEGWLCESCGQWVCPLCVDLESERCYPCFDGSEAPDWAAHA